MNDMSERLKALADAGVSIWLDDLSRERLNSNNLADLVAESSVVGVTTNPTIFASALAKGEAYDAQMDELAARDGSVEDAIKALTTDDVRNACDVLAATSAATHGVDGRVSIEVEPGLARDTDATIAQAQDLWKIVDRPNLLIKIPATLEGLPAITAVIGEGISVNVTLIFSLERYEAVIDAYLSGWSRPPPTVTTCPRSTRSPRSSCPGWTPRCDKRLDAIGTDEATALKSKAAIANARLAYEVFQQAFASDRWEALAAQGANKQRPLWASTGVKDPIAAGHPVRDRAGRGRHRQHDAGEDHAGLRRPR